MTGISVNRRASLLADEMALAADRLRIRVSRGACGERLIDAGSAATGGIEAGLSIAGICMGGLGDIGIVPEADRPRWPWTISVRSSQPIIACLGSQYAGWSLAHGDYFALGSGPARALAAQESVFADIGYRDKAETATIVLETGKAPPAEIVDMIARDCAVSPASITVIFAPTQSLAGSVQVVGRVLEVALHKAHTLRFPLRDIVDGLASAPLSPPHPSFVTAMGRTNDAIIYGGRVHLFVTGSTTAARKLAEDLPSRGSRDYGRPFAEIFKRSNGDFYAIDPMLFSPAEAMVTALDTGETFRSGGIDTDLLDASFA